MRRIILAGLATAVMSGAVMFGEEGTPPNTRLRNATVALHDIMGSPDKGIPRDLIARSRCVVVVPDLLKGAFVVGGKYGRGFASCRRGNGWSAPAAVRIEGGSFGFQLGGSATDLVMLVTDRRGMDRLLSDKFTIGGEATAAAGPVGRDTTAQTDVLMRAEILSWSRSRGLFAGISLDGATLRPDSSENRKLYGRQISNREILEGPVAIPQDARQFVSELARIVNKSGPVIAEPMVGLRAPGGRIRLTEHEVRFAPSQYAVGPDAEPALAGIARTLKDNPQWRVRIEGFTDNVGPRDANQKLSEQRAHAVMDWLASHGVSRDRISARGYGESHPVADNSTNDGRARNRRVEIVRTGAT